VLPEEAPLPTIDAKKTLEAEITTIVGEWRDSWVKSSAMTAVYLELPKKTGVTKEDYLKVTNAYRKFDSAEVQNVTIQERNIAITKKNTDIKTLNKALQETYTQELEDYMVIENAVRKYLEEWQKKRKCAYTAAHARAFEDATNYD
jgi:hypothetical protein